MPTQSSTDTLTVTFNRNLTNAEKSSFSGILKNKETSSGVVRDYELASDGGIYYELTGRGGYTISGNTLTISLISSVYVTEIVLNV